MVAYLDSSVILRHILLGDMGIKQAFQLDEVVTSELTEIECRRVLQRYRMQQELDDQAYVEAIKRLEHVLGSVSILALSSEVKKRAAEAFPIQVKTLDALHLASALRYATVYPDKEMLVYSYDAAFNRCAVSIGFTAPYM